MTPSQVDLLSAIDDRISVTESVSDWKEAVILSGQLLHSSGCVEAEYIEKMIKTCQELGPYIAIAPGIAIPHARPEDGAKKVCFSILIVKRGVNFGSHNDPVYVLIAFSTPDKSSHIVLIQNLAELLLNKGEEMVKQLSKASSPQEVRIILENLLKNI
jgi:PTS system ascorbate-specific IIA component